LLNDKARYLRSHDEIAARFNTERTAAEYEALFAELQRRSPRQVRLR
jgi:hypothetical protein